MVTKSIITTTAKGAAALNMTKTTTISTATIPAYMLTMSMCGCTKLTN